MSVWTATFVPYVYALGWSLLHFFWQGTMIAVPYALLRGRCGSSAARYRLGMFCVALMLACPVVTLALLWPTIGEASATAAAASTLPAVAIEQTGASFGLEGLLPWCVGAWLVGVCLIALRSFLHWRRLSDIVHSATPLPREWQLRLIQLSQRFGILRPVRLLSSLEVGVPTLIGWLKPTILLPVSLLSGFTPTQVELILAHELAHVRRYDYIANLVQVVVETLLFYHPVVHWICADVRHQREQCCDDLVLSVGGGERLTYARTLADLEEWIQDRTEHGFGTAVPALGAGGGVLLARVQHIVEPSDVQRANLPRRSGFTLPALVVCAGLLIASVRLNETVHDALAQASAVSAELLANATFHIRADKPAFPLQLKPMVVVSSPALPVVEHTTAPQAHLAQAALTAEVPVPHIEIPAQSREAAVSIPPVRQETEAEAKPAPTKAVAEDKPAAAKAVADDKPAAPPATVVSSNLQPVHVVSPSYPTSALRDGVTGKVDLDFRIGADGSVQDVRVLAARPAGVFEQAAVAAIRQWRFAAPGTPDSTRYARSFAFSRGNSPTEPCREITGSHICRGLDADSKAN